MQIESKIDVKSDNFKENKEFHLGLAEELQKKLDHVHLEVGRGQRLDLKNRVNLMSA